MGLSTFPAASGGGIKSVQRGAAGSSGNVTITSVNIAKSFVTVFGTASAGTVATTGSIPSLNFTINALVLGNSNPDRGGPPSSGTVPAHSLSGGTNNLVSAVVQGFLANSTTLTVSGACRWEVVEFV